MARSAIYMRDVIDLSDEPWQTAGEVVTGFASFVTKLHNTA